MLRRVRQGAQPAACMRHHLVSRRPCLVESGRVKFGSFLPFPAVQAFLTKAGCRSERSEPLLQAGPTRQGPPRYSFACKTIRPTLHREPLDSICRGKVAGQTPRRDARLDAQRGAVHPLRHAAARRSPGAAPLGRPVLRGTRCAVLPHLPRDRRRQRRADITVHVQGCGAEAPRRNPGCIASCCHCSHRLHRGPQSTVLLATHRHAAVCAPKVLEEVAGDRPQHAASGL